MIRLALIALLFVSVAGCKDKKSKKEPAKQTATKTANDAEAKKAKKPPPPSLDQPFPDEVVDEFAASLEGNWVIKAQALVDGALKSQKQAWKIGDGVATLASTDGEDTGDFELIAPCRFKFSGGDGPATYFNFITAGEQLHIGAGRAALVIGDDVVACTGDGIFVIRQGKCSEWRQAADGKWSSKPANCGLAGGGNGFKIGVYVIPGDGKVFVDGQLQISKAKSYEDFGSAKVAVGIFAKE
jgi:hypothetical protein